MILTSSCNYIIKNEYEIAYLLDKNNGCVISSIAELYGDPIDARISVDEKYCVVIGCGAVIYWLKEPFNNYKYASTNIQWINILIDCDVWFDSILELNDTYVILHAENGDLYRINIYTKEIFKQ